MTAEPSASEPCCACGPCCNTCCCPVFDAVLTDDRSDVPSVSALDSNAVSSVDTSLAAGKHKGEAHFHVLNIQSEISKTQVILQNFVHYYYVTWRQKRNLHISM